MNEETIPYKPKHYFLDEKDAKYYRNRDLNSNAMKTKYIRNISNYITSLQYTMEKLIYEDSHGIISSELNDMKNNIEQLQNLIEVMANKVTEEKMTMTSTDYDKIIQSNTQKIIELENN